MKNDSPIVVGGGGGSGTRVVAEILSGLGVDTGFDLNGAHDDLTWTMLLKRAWWKTGATNAQIHHAMSVYDRARAGDGSHRHADRRYAARAAVQRVFHGTNKNPLARAMWGARRVQRFAARRPRPEAALWGWKEPSTHVFLPELCEHYPGMRYIHMIRHGLDMALSSNQIQARRWSREYGLDTPRGPVSPRRSLAYWVRSNSRAIATGTERLGGRFLLLRFEDLCDEPAAQIERLASFVGVTPSDETSERLSALPRSPASRGRFIGHPLDDFDPEDLRAVAELGYAAAAPVPIQAAPEPRRTTA